MERFIGYSRSRPPSGDGDGMGPYTKLLFQVTGMVQEPQDFKPVVVKTEEYSQAYIIDACLLGAVMGEDLPFIVPFGSLVESLIGGTMVRLLKELVRPDLGCL
jgi:hypothetical protein